MSERFFIETHGCEMNKAESSALTGRLSALGMHESAKAEEADWIILNTCSVRKTAEERIFGRLGFFREIRAGRGSKIAVIGCMAERLKETLTARPHMVDFAGGALEHEALIATIIGSGAPGAPSQAYQFFPYHGATDALCAFVPIMNGCDNFCSYCVVPYVRGREISRDPNEIVAEILRLVNNGVKDVTLLGQNVIAYRHNGTNFADLMLAIEREIPGDVRFRFTSSHPKDLSHQIIDAWVESPRFMRALHLAAQHGSDKVLREMNRRYTASQYLALLEEARLKLPGLVVTTDLLTGFPGESDQDFEALLAFVRQAGFMEAYTYKYNDREETPAYHRTDKISEEVKTERIIKLVELQRELSARLAEKRVGDTIRVLAESESSRGKRLFGHSDLGEPVVFEGDKASIGLFIMVKITDVHGQTLIGGVS